VAVGGGGYVTGIVVHPIVRNLAYIRTDVGGAYRWDHAKERWTPLTESFSVAEENLYGIESIALDASNPNVVYIAAGKYDKATLERWGTWKPGDPEPNDVLKSTDRGRTWTRTGLNVNINGNGNGRNNGERLAVDPNNGNIVYFGSRWDGLWRSTSAASPGSWQKVEALPNSGAAGQGISFVLFDGRGGKQGQATSTIYLGAWGVGVYRSSDAGVTWELLSGSPAQPRRAALATDGTLFVSHEVGVARLDGAAWTNISPVAAKFVGITIDPSNPNIVMAARGDSAFRQPIFRSTDRGQSWTEVQYIQQGNVPWWPDSFWSAATASLLIDPHNSQRVWYTDWYGTWRTDNINAQPSTWRTFEEGHEEVVTFDLQSPASGAPLLSGVADVDGFRHTSLDSFPTISHNVPNLQDTTSLAIAETNPEFVARVGGRRWNDTGDGGYSTDGGVTWSSFPTVPTWGAKNGRVAVSASGDRIVWLPQGGVPAYTTNNGCSWSTSAGAPSGVVGDVWTWHKPLAADRVDNNTFYLYKDGSFYRSTNGAVSWSRTAGLPYSGGNMVAAAPGVAGEVWVSLENEGLYRSSDAGSSFTKLANVERALLFSFGKGAPGSNSPAVYVYGRIDGRDGIFRSDDMGTSWEAINIPEITVGNSPNAMAGDRQTYGRVYIGTNGRGIYYGQPKHAPAPAPVVTPPASANAAPSVEITSPATKATFMQGANVTINASAADSDGSVSKVEFYLGCTKLHEATSAPYSFTWSNVQPGIYRLFAKATDNNGAVTTSTAVDVQVEKPKVGPEVLLITASGTNSSEAAIKNRLEQAGYSVTVKAASASTSADANGKALVLVSSTVSSGAVAAKFRDVATPVIVWEPFVYDDMGLTGTNAADYNVTSEGYSEIEVANASPLDLQLQPGLVQVYTEPRQVVWGKPGAGAQVIAALKGDPMRAVLFTYEKGATLANGSPAAGRRVGMFLFDDTVSALTANGLALFDASVRWATQAP
jgi:hypothetical protein